MPDLKIFLLNRFEVMVEGCPVPGQAWRGERSRSLLQFLATRHGFEATADEVMEALWPHLPAEQARQSLHVTVSRLRSALCPAGVLKTRGGDLVQATSRGYRLHEATRVDLLQFQELVRETQAISRRAPGTALERLRTAGVSKLPTLAVDQPYADWACAVRERIRRDYVTLQTLRANLLLEASQAPEALDTLLHVLELEPILESATRQAMLVAYNLGDQVLALHVFDRCRRALADELGVAPLSETLQLHARILRQQAAAAEASTAPAPGDLEQQVYSKSVPLVGREAELGEVRRELSRARTGPARMILIEGEAGMGKSHLLAELLQRRIHSPGDSGGTVIRGSCYEAFGSLPFAPVTEALRQALAHLDPARPSIPDLWLAEVARLIPELGLGRSGLQPRVQPDSQPEYLRMFEGVAQFLAALPRPVTLVLEDLHWADESSLLLLAYLARSESARGLAMVATARLGEAPDGVQNLCADLQREGRLAKVALGPLTLEGVRWMVSACSGDRHPGLAERLYAETGGHPFYTVEMLRGIMEGGGGDRLSLPTSLQEAVAHRLNRLPPAARDLLSALSVFPQGAAFSIVQRVAGLAESDALAALDLTLRGGILREVPEPAGAMRLTPPRITFGHDIPRRVVNARLGGTKVQALHRSACAALQELGEPASGKAEQLAYHATAGALWQQGADWNEAAATAAEKVFAYSSAPRFL